MDEGNCSGGVWLCLGLHLSVGGQGCGRVGIVGFEL